MGWSIFYVHLRYVGPVRPIHPMRAENGYVEICPRQNSKSAKPPPNANLVHFLHRDCRTIVQIRVE